MPKTAANIPANETKADTFKRVAGQRTYNALEAIRKLEALANLGAYEYSAEQVNKIVSALHAAVQKVEDTFDGKVNKTVKTFEV